MTDISNVKLVIWDLDETLWEGTLSEGGARIPDSHVRLLRNLTDCGIVNSICSRNEWEPTKEFLQKAGVWDFFVFPSINWESKGPQLKEKLDKMALRPINTLFIDDNPSNLGEARHFLPEIQTCGPEGIPDLIRQVEGLEKKDLLHKRLKQYKILEEKDTASRTYESNEAFLYDSDIQVEIHKDCVNQIQRIHELLLRSNQLNFTKKRIPIGELESILRNPVYDCGYVSVKDRFGDYGIVGFYAKTEERLEHFLFSCRTMGQQIEQWVYAEIGFPELDVVGEVRTQLNREDRPGWINQNGRLPEDGLASHGLTTCGKVLLKGPCDLSHSLVYIKGSVQFDTEFTYVSNGNGQIIDAYNHSVHIEGLYTYSDQDKVAIIQDCIFVDPDMLTGTFFTKKYDLIVLSTLIESTYQIYRKKGTDVRVVFGGLDMTDPDNWGHYINHTTYTGGNVFTEEYLRSFSNLYECIGQTTPEMYVSFLRKCLAWLPEETTLCLILGATKVFDGQEDVKRKHAGINAAIKGFASDHPRIKYIEIDECIHGPSDFDGEINHFSARVYYELAQQIIRVIQTNTGESIKSYPSWMVAIDNLTLAVRKALKRVFSQNSPVYGKLKNIYNRIYKHRK